MLTITFSGKNSNGQKCFSVIWGDDMKELITMGSNVNFLGWTNGELIERIYAMIELMEKNALHSVTF